MYVWSGLFLSCTTVLALIPDSIVRQGKLLWEYRDFLWKAYMIKRNMNTSNQTLLVINKLLANIPYDVREDPWISYRDIKNMYEPIWPYLIRIDNTSADKNTCSIANGTDSREVLNFSSYSYLNAVKDEEIRTFVIRETLKGNYAFGNHGPRMLGGNNKWLCTLEKTLASYTRREAAITFSSGFLACKSAIQAVVGPKDVIFADNRVHESLRDGIRAAKSNGSKRFYFSHNNYDSLEKLLQDHRSKSRKAYIVVESVYSMDGDIVDLAKVQKLANQYEARIILDEAHGLGILGRTGRGVEELQNVPQAAWLIVGSFTKVFGSVGGYICGSQEMIDYLHFFATGTMFSAPMSVPAALAAYATLEAVDKHPEWLQETRANMRYLKAQLMTLEERHQIKAQSEDGSPLVALIMKDFNSVRVLTLATRLRKRGFYVAAVNAPACPLREPRLRLTAPRGITTQEIDSFVRALDEELTSTLKYQDKRLMAFTEIMDAIGL